MISYDFKINYASDSVVLAAGDAGLVAVSFVVVGVGSAPSSILGTIKLSLDIKLYFMTKEVNLRQRWEDASKSSNRVLWWKYACEKILYTRLHTDPSLPREDSRIETLKEYKSF